eukprot:scaffold51519_cov49-Phaeocystis_antarctica.AAC.2
MAGLLWACLGLGLENGGDVLGARPTRPPCGVRRSPLVHWRLLTRLLDSPVVVWSWFCDIKIPHTDPYIYSRLATRPATQGQSPTCGSRSQSLSSREASV